MVDDDGKLRSHIMETSAPQDVHLGYVRGDGSTRQEVLAAFDL